jgi:excinuclease ABC subunit C
VPGVGPVTRKKLIKNFGSVRGVQEASIEEIAAIIGDLKARTIKQHLHN